MTTTVKGGREEIELLRARLKGTLALPGEPGYELCGTWNTAVRLRPRALIAAASADDVVETIRFAGAHGCRVAAHCTGHGAAPIGGDVLLIHTGALDEIHIDPSTRRARLGAGVCWEPVINAAAPFGLAPVAGSATGVGVAGFLTGGGIGPLVRTFGVSSDWVDAFDVVTGEGDRLRVTAEENRDLFWGLRGGKGTLGVVCGIEISLVGYRRLYGGAIFYDGDDTEAVLRRWRTWAQALPEHANTSLALLRLPAAPSVPAPLAGRLSVAVRFASLKPANVCESLLTEMRDVATPLIDTIDTIPSTEIGAVHADPATPRPVREAGALLRELPDAGIEALLKAAGPGSSSTLNIVELRLLGGAYGRPGAHPSAFCHRDAAYNLAVIGSPRDDRDLSIAASADAVLDAIAPWSTGGVLPNFASSTDPHAIRRRYDDATLVRLSALAEWYDPAGVLRAGQVVRDV